MNDVMIRIADWLLAANMMWRGCEFAAMGLHQPAAMLALLGVEQ